MPSVVAPAIQNAESGSTDSVAGSSTGAGRESGSSQRHLPLLDGVRGLAILMVVVLHVAHTGRSEVGIDRLVRKLATTGWMGVDLFFVLSGFLITGILLDAKNDPHYFRNFYMRRVLRIFPLNYAFLIALVIIVPWVAPAVAASFGSLPSIKWPYWIFLGNFANGFYPNPCPSLGALWSLAIEEQFYLIWPLIVLMLRPRTFGKVCLALVAVSAALRWIFLLRGMSYDTLRCVTFTHMDPIALGSYLAVARRTGGLRRFLPGAWTLALILPIVLLVMSVSSGTLTSGRAFSVVGLTLVSLMFAAIMTLTLEGVRLMQIFGLAWLRWFGRRSYAIYLCNLPVIDILNKFAFTPDANVAAGHSTLPRLTLFFALTLIGCALVASLSWNLFEKHFLRLKSLFPMTRRSVRSSAQAIMPGEVAAVGESNPATSAPSL
jgi:peptidoglycan/LPS O-acetylase OafA/YrhL